MQGYGRDESAPTPGGVFAPISWVSVGISRNVRHAFRGVFCVYFVGVRGFFTVCSLHYGNPFAAVGADLSCPHIRIHPQNDKRKCVCGDVEMCI